MGHHEEKKKKHPMQKKVKHAVKRFEEANTVVDSLFTGASLLVVDILAIVALIAVALSTWGVILQLGATISAGDYTEGMVHIITSTLTVFIFIEVLSVSIRYLKIHNIDIKDLIDVSFAIILRELWVGLFSGHIEFKEMLGYACLILVLGLVRWLTLRSRAKGEELSIEAAQERFGDSE